MSEVFAYEPKGMLAKRLRAKAVAVWDVDGIEVILTSPAIKVAAEVSFDLNTNRHIGNIDVEGLSS
mgnify:FL=1